MALRLDYVVFLKEMHRETKSTDQNPHKHDYPSKK